jgi:P4 family phage/plasmid primase-like protien
MTTRQAENKKQRDLRKSPIPDALSRFRSHRNITRRAKNEDRDSAESARRRGKKKVRGRAEDTSVQPGVNDHYISQLFSDFAQARVKYQWNDGKSGVWMIWNGKVWEADRDGEIFRTVDNFRSHIYMSSWKSGQQDLLIKIAYHMTQQPRRKRMLEMAQSEMLLKSVPEDYDQDPLLFNCNNGVIDLATGELLPHDPRYMMTRITHVDYDPDATSKLWNRCISQWTGRDKELIEFLQRSVGYAMVGQFYEKRFWFLYGVANTAKTTFLQVLQHALGLYGRSADIRMFLEKTGFINVGPRPEVLKLRGLRFVKAEEAGQHSKYDAEFVKLITGGSSVVARNLYSGTLHEFVPFAKLWIGSNWAPKAEYIDQALWDRMLAVPFTHVIPNEHQDTELVHKLTTDPRHNKAILAWMVRGCFKWQDDGLKIPEIVTRQTRLLHEQSDDLLEFKEECLVVTGDNDDYILCQNVNDVYVTWCILQGIPARFRKKSRSLYEQITADPGVSKSERTEYRDKKRGRFFYGLKLTPQAINWLGEKGE